MPIVLMLIVCADLYAMHKSIEQLSEELSSLRNSIREDVKNRNYLANCLQEKEDECFELRERLNSLIKVDEQVDDEINTENNLSIREAITRATIRLDYKWKNNVKLIKGVPKKYNTDMSFMLKENDKELFAIVMRIVSKKDGDYIPDLEGNIIEYLVACEEKPRYDTKEDLDKKLVEYEFLEK